MTAHGFIAGYVSVWFGWSSLVASALPRRGQRVSSLRFCGALSISGCALIPVVALAVVAHYTPWIPKPINEMLSLMTPVLLAIFVMHQLVRREIWNRRQGECTDVSMKERVHSGRSR